MSWESETAKNQKFWESGNKPFIIRPPGPNEIGVHGAGFVWILYIASVISFSV